MSLNQSFFSYILTTLKQKNYRKAIFRLVLLLVLSMLMELVIPFVTKSIVDQGINNQDISFINLVLLSLLMLSIGSLSSDVFRKWLLRHVSLRIRIQMDSLFMTKALQKTTVFFARMNEGEFIQNANDNQRIERFFQNHISGFLELLLKLTIYSFVLLQFDTRIGLIFLLFVGLSIIWDSFYINLRAKQDALNFNARSLGRGYLVETINGITDIKVNGMEKARLGRWSGIQKVLALSNLEMLSLHQQVTTGVLFVNQIRDVIIIYFSAISVVNGVLTLGGMLAIQYILGQLNKQTNTFLLFVVEYQQAKLSYERVQKFASEEGEEDFGEGGATELPDNAPIVFEGVDFSYDGKKTVLKDIDLQIPFGTKVAIVGESGSGKSTMVKIMLKLMPPTKGIARIGSRKLAHINTKTWRDNCGILLQESILFHGSIKYNITLLEDDKLVDYERLDQVVEICQITDLIQGMENGSNTLIGQQGVSLSKGQAQRVMLARAIYKNADYLVVDEPTSALDALTAFTVFENIKEYYNDRTMILITHKINIARQMDLIYVVEDGKIIEQGKHDALMAKEGKYYQLATIK